MLELYKIADQSMLKKTETFLTLVKLEITSKKEICNFYYQFTIST